MSTPASRPPLHVCSPNRFLYTTEGFAPAEALHRISVSPRGIELTVRGVERVASDRFLSEHTLIVSVAITNPQDASRFAAAVTDAVKQFDAICAELTTDAAMARGGGES